ncbi:MAG: hypothetical protein Crog4KO_26030 [Crocinitomicaceae bacterium]
MKKKQINAWLIALIAVSAVSGVVITYRVFKRRSFLNKLIVFIKKWEGGLSRKLSDTASRNPSPWRYNGVTGWHTNKGVTYETFVSLSKRVGYAVTANNFFNMSSKLWMRILFEGYMKPYPLEQLKHLPRIQAVIITWAWGSGLAGSERRLANFQREVMGIVDGNISKTEIVENFKRRINPRNERKWFNLLCDRRAEDFMKMSTFGANGRGWLRRLADFRATFA